MKTLITAILLGVLLIGCNEHPCEVDVSGSCVYAVDGSVYNVELIEMVYDAVNDAYNDKLGGSLDIRRLAEEHQLVIKFVPVDWDETLSQTTTQGLPNGQLSASTQGYFDPNWNVIAIEDLSENNHVGHKGVYKTLGHEFIHFLNHRHRHVDPSVERNHMSFNSFEEYYQQGHGEYYNNLEYWVKDYINDHFDQISPR